MEKDVPPAENEYGEVLDTKKVFLQTVKKKKKVLISLLLFSAVWIFVCINFLPQTIRQSEMGFYIIFFPLILPIGWMVSLYAKIREAFWKQLALKYGWEYTLSKNITVEKALLFQMGHSPAVHHGITGKYNDRPFHIFEYEYTVGGGKNKSTFSFTVFEIKFTGTFPHLYLNYKKDWYSNTPSLFSSLANIPVPKEFADKFKLYAPKEYEIETLQIFTPDIFAILIDSEWKHDMEFVDGELIIYSKKLFSNFKNLDEELTRIKKFIEILSPKLDKLKLTQIGDISPLLKN